LDWILYVFFGLNIVYLLIYSLASLRRKPSQLPASPHQKQIVVLIPAYHEDAVIFECVQSCLNQTYPSDRFDTVVISDGMHPQTNAALSTRPVRLVEVHFKESTKAKALNAAMNAIDRDYDIAVVLDADNIIPPTFLADINNLFANPAVEVAQAHRVAKNVNNHIAYLDAVSEEINNTIFRLGHARLGMSAALIGSGMAFNYRLFRETMANIHAVGGFDRELELTLLYQGKRFHYLPDTHVLDEKIQNHNDFSRQRRRWMSAQWHYSMIFTYFLLKAIRAHRWDFCDKLYQQFSLPRLLLIGFTFLIAAGWSFISISHSLKWWGLFLLLAAALLIAIPRRYYTRRMVLAVTALPYTFLTMALNIFKLRGANKKFIHTAHRATEKK
jgi:cellulose synthase/poly-beta-1,6-N-acetylglucosamine synthase-like glycosyltransferase